MSLVRMGTGEAYSIGAIGLHAGLEQGHRSFTLTDQDQPWNYGPIDLNQYSGQRDLYLDGGGAYRMTNCARGGSWPMFVGENWQIHFRGITLQGCGYDAPLIDMPWIDSSTFDNCGFVGVGSRAEQRGSPAVRLGVGGQCSTTRFTSCWAEDCGGELYHIENGVDVGWRDGYMQRSNGAIYFRGKPNNHGLNSMFIDGVHLEQNGREENGQWVRPGIDIDNVDAALLCPSYRYATSLKLGPSAYKVRVVNHVKFDCGTDQGMDSWSNKRGNVYVW
jgi:hypothetical protein